MFTITTGKLTQWERYAAHNFKDYELTGVSSLNSPKNNTVIFVTDINDVVNSKLTGVSAALILAPAAKEALLSKNIIAANDVFPCRDPRAEYAILLNKILRSNAPADRIASSAIIEEGAFIGENTIVEHQVFIAATVTCKKKGKK